MLVRVVSQALGQLYCPSACEATRKDKGKIYLYQTITNDSNGLTKYLFLWMDHRCIDPCVCLVNNMTNNTLHRLWPKWNHGLTIDKVKPQLAPGTYCSTDHLIIVMEVAILIRQYYEFVTIQRTSFQVWGFLSLRKACSKTTFSWKWKSIYWLDIIIWKKSLDIISL